jgi:CheY-like chemotaxis protein
VRIDPAPEVVADERLLVQAFLNLLISFSLVLPEGHADERSVTVEVGTTEDGRAFVQIAGAGPRIEPHELVRALDPYSPTGAGLHLSVCQNVIASMGGYIEVPPDAGALRAFRVLLPAAQEKVETIPVPAAATTEDPADGLRVLVIDDETLVARSLRRALRGHDVTIADGGQRAMEILEGGQRFDVVLCDLMMPDISGMELFDRVQKELPEMASRFVFMTGGAFTATARAFLDRVANHRIDKPFEVALVREIVREIGSRSSGAPPDDVL